MFTVTDSALTVLRERLAAEGMEDSGSFRLTRQDDNFLLGIGQPAEGDLRFEQDSKLVLSLDKNAAEALEGTVLDVEQSPEGARLVLLVEEEGQEG